jgi:putative DNA primase/helicase
VAFATLEEAKAAGEEFNNKGRACLKCRVRLVTTATATMCDGCEVAEYHDRVIKPEKGKIEFVRKTDEHGVIHQIVGYDASTVKPQAQEWLWWHKIPANAITWFFGKPNGTKSLSTCELAAIVSTGRDWPDGTKNELGPRRVIMYNAEDDIKRTVIPRLMVAKANLKNIRLLDHTSFRTYDPTGKDGEKHSLDLTRDMPILSSMLVEDEDIVLCIADPITGIWGGKNVNHDQEVVKVLEKLKELCEKRKLTFIGVSHVNKRSDVDALQSVLGGSSMTAKARAMYMFSQDPDSDDHHDHVMVWSKGNLSDDRTGLKLRTVGVEMTFDGVTESYPKIVWGEITGDAADDVNAKRREKQNAKDSKREAAKEFIKSLLVEKPMMSFKVYNACEAAKFAESTYKKAAEDLSNDKQIVRKQRDSKWWMMLPEQLPDFLEDNFKPEPAMMVEEGEAL